MKNANFKKHNSQNRSRWGTLELHRDGNYIEAEILQYKSEADYMAGSVPMSGRSVRFDGENNPVTLQNTTQLMYDFYRNIVEFYEEFDGGAIVT